MSDTTMARQSSAACALGAVVLLSSLVVSCAGRRTITREELRSDLISAISAAGETEMSIDFVVRGQMTRSFASGHFRYLANQLEDSTKELSDSMAAPGLQESVRNGRVQVDALSGELKAIASEADSPQALANAKQRLEAIRKVLEQETASL
jgi:hypothetical protein